MRQPNELEIAADPFWLDVDLDTHLGAVQPYPGPAECVIEDLTDQERDHFVTALQQ